MSVAAVEARPGAGALDVSPFQARLLELPEALCIALTGGRGGGKTRGAGLLALRHVGQYGAAARVLWLRQSHRGAADAQGQLLEIFSSAFGAKEFRYNANAGIFTAPGGGTVELNQIAAPSDYRKFQGSSHTLLVVDEATQWSAPALLDRLRSNLRGPRHVPTRIVLIGNPGEVGHGWVAKRHALREPWDPYAEDWTEDGGRQWVTAPSTYLENPFIDGAAYRRELAAACADDPELLASWLRGDWSVIRGSYFADVLSDDVALEDVTREELTAAVYQAEHRHRETSAPAADLFLSHDFGSAAPSVTYLCLRSGGLHLRERYFRPGSILLLDELATASADDPSTGLRLTIPELAREIAAMADRWHAPRRGVADDAIFAQSGHEAGSIADEFHKCGISFQPAGKGGRVDGWQRMRTLLKGAAEPDRPGLHVARRCRYWWETVPVLQRDPRRREDLDTTGPDHAADASRYAFGWVRPVVTSKTMLL